jgi:hypothetical protein
MSRRHVFVVLRHDRFDPPLPDATGAIVATKAFWSEEEAEAEVRRLNQVNAAAGATYFWRIARLDPEPSD